jgi:hypothetical protein
MRLKITLILLTCVYTLNAQVGIGTTTPQGELDIVTSADLGLVVPRVSDIDNVTDGSGGTPVNGTVVYDLSRESICYYTNNRWICLTSDASGTVTISDNTMPLSGASNYIKASNTDISDTFGAYVALSGDGLTLAVGAVGEDSNATGINGDESNNGAVTSGAVYVYVKSGGVWAQQAYIKASNAEAIDFFGRSLALDFTGDTLAVGASAEDSNATGIGGSQADNSADNTGAVYVFSRSGTTWTQQEYIKASNAETVDEFGTSLDLSDDGNTLVVGAPNEDSNATGVGGSQADNSSTFSGAVYVFTRAGTVWSQQAYIKASNTGDSDLFGLTLSISGDGNTLAVGAYREDGGGVGINPADSDTATFSGAAYVYVRSAGVWSFQAYIKSSNSESFDGFGWSQALSYDGNTMLVTAYGEMSNATGVDGDQTDNTISGAGAAYLFERSGSTWLQTHYIKASNPDIGDRFGDRCDMSNDGSKMLISAQFEQSAATGLNGNQVDNSLSQAGAAYMFVKVAGVWSQRLYIKASNTEFADRFSADVKLNASGTVGAFGASYEDSNATGVGGDQTNNSANEAGAVYIYEN